MAPAKPTFGLPERKASLKRNGLAREKSYAIHLNMRNITLMVNDNVFGENGMMMTNTHLSMRDIILIVNVMVIELSSIRMVILLLIVITSMISNNSSVTHVILTSLGEMSTLYNHHNHDTMIYILFM